MVKKKANVARLKIYTKRAGEDETSGPSAKKSKVHRIAKYNIYFYMRRVQTKGPILMEVESQSQEDSGKPDPKRGGAPEPKTLPQREM